MRSVESSFAAPRQVAGRALLWWTGTSRSAAFVQGFAGLLLLYLPLENWLTAGLTGSLQWVVRLFPDALICLLAAIVAVGMAGGLLRYRWALVGIAVVTGLIVVGDLMRGFGAIDSVNAVRVVVRYLALGAVLAAVLPRDQSFAGALWSTVIVVGIVQIVAAVVQILATAAAGGAAGIPILTGTTGR